MYNTINWEDSPSTKTPITAANLRHMDNQIKENADTIESFKSEISFKMFGTLFTGETELVFNSDKITGEGTYQLSSSIYGISPYEMTSEVGKVTCKFKPQVVDVNFQLRFWE